MEAKDLDGFEELSEESQEKVLKALEAGHVDDADWKGVCVLFFPLCSFHYRDRCLLV